MRVIIKDEKFIPGVGQGPITKPVSISEHTYRHLILAGYRVFKVVTPKPSIMKDKEAVKNTVVEEVIKEEPKAEKVEQPKKEVEETPAPKKVEEDLTEEVKEKESTKEVKEEKPKESEKKSDEVDYSDKTVQELKDILKEHDIKFAYNARRDDLLILLAEI